MTEIPKTLQLMDQASALPKPKSLWRNRLWTCLLIPMIALTACSPSVPAPTIIPSPTAGAEMVAECDFFQLEEYGITIPFSVIANEAAMAGTPTTDQLARRIDPILHASNSAPIVVNLQDGGVSVNFAELPGPGLEHYTACYGLPTDEEITEVLSNPQNYNPELRSFCELLAVLRVLEQEETINPVLLIIDDTFETRENELLLEAFGLERSDGVARQWGIALRRSAVIGDKSGLVTEEAVHALTKIYYQDLRFDSPIVVSDPGHEDRVYISWVSGWNFSWRFGSAGDELFLQDLLDSDSEGGFDLTETFDHMIARSVANRINEHYGADLINFPDDSRDALVFEQFFKQLNIVPEDLLAIVLGVQGRSIAPIQALALLVQARCIDKQVSVSTVLADPDDSEIWLKGWPSYVWFIKLADVAQIDEPEARQFAWEQLLTELQVQCSW